VQYEWDRSKARANATKHGVRFGDAIVALEDDRAVTIRDPFHDDEERWITIGRDAFGRVLVAVYTWRGENIRLISARLASLREQSQYEEDT
jgi:uncharacterized protein